MELSLAGGNVIRGVARGEIVVRERLEPSRRRESAGMEEDGRAADAGSRIRQAVADCVSHLERLRLPTGLEAAAAHPRQGADAGERVVEAYEEILRDPVLTGRMEELAAGGREAREAVVLAFEEFAGLFEAMDDPYIRGRGKDLRDLSELLVSFIGAGSGAGSGTGPADLRDLAESAASGDYVLVTRRLSVPELLSLEKGRLKGLVSAEGNETAHIAIVAKGIGLPAVFGSESAYEALSAHHGDEVILDVGREVAVIAPGEAALADYERVQEAAARRFRRLEAHRCRPARLRDGIRVEVMANVGSVRDAALAAEAGVDGIGLLRTEILFGGEAQMPGVDEQARVYREIAELVPGLPVVIRAFDIGGDKPMAGGEPGRRPEENPFLGLRGWRFLESREEWPETQFRAVLLAARSHPVELMVPMVSTVEEAVRAKELWRKAAGQAGIAPPPFGIMVEVPSVALTADAFAPHVDFFSLGTNDLTQYALAVDRTNVAVRPLYQQFHPSVLRLVREVANAGSRGGVRVSVCGELAGDALGGLLLVGLGVRRLSVAPSSVLELKDGLSRFTAEELRDAANRALDAPTEQEAVTVAKKALFG